MKIPNTPFSTDGKKNWKRRGKNSKLACQNEIHDRETESVCVCVCVYVREIATRHRFRERLPLRPSMTTPAFNRNPLLRLRIRPVPKDHDFVIYPPPDIKRP